MSYGIICFSYVWSHLVALAVNSGAVMQKEKNGPVLALDPTPTTLCSALCYVIVIAIMTLLQHSACELDSPAQSPLFIQISQAWYWIY